MSKHTPGPWTIIEERTICAGDEIVAEATDTIEGLDGDDLVAEANARLIAAAPELLEGLQLALKHIADAIRLESNSFDEEPSPATKEDYEADLLCAHLDGIIRKAISDL